MNEDGYCNLMKLAVKPAQSEYAALLLWQIFPAWKAGYP
jgi:hypothetical protein